MDFYCLCLVREVGSLFALSNVINEKGNFFLDLKTVKLQESTLLYPSN